MNEELHLPETSEEVPKRREQSQDVWRFAAELVRTALIVALLAYGLRLFVLQPFVVEGSSMFPRFQTNDFLIVDKVSYHIKTPARGDIIVFKFPYDLNTNYVKRIIGLPGDTVTIENGNVKVANETHPEGSVLAEPYLSAGSTTQLTSSSSKNQFVVPDGQFFVLGDNRKASSDSREWGFLPASNIIGRAVVQVFPVKRASFVAHARYDSLK